MSVDYVFMVDPWWIPQLKIRQLMELIVSDKQTKCLPTTWSKNTIEEKIIHIQKKKQALADDIINSEQGLLSKLSKEIVENLLS